MYSNIAFNNDAALKQQMIRQLETHLVEETIRDDLIFWDGTTGSFSGVAVQGDLDTYQHLTGIPKAFALLGDQIYREGDSSRNKWARSWFSSLPVGRNLSQLEQQLIEVLLNSEQGALPLTRHYQPTLPRDNFVLLEQLLELHQRNPATVSTDEWHRVQIQAMTLTDASAEITLASMLGQFAEALSWPTGSSASLLTASWNALSDIHYFYAMYHCGWNDKWEAKRQELYQRFNALTADYQPASDDGYTKEGQQKFYQLYQQMSDEVPGYNDITTSIEQWITEARERLQQRVISLLNGKTA